MKPQPVNRVKLGADYKLYKTILSEKSLANLKESSAVSLLGKRCFLFYPPGDLYQRGEDRSQGNVSDSAATVMRAPNDMGYASAILKQRGCEVEFIDFQTEGKSMDDLVEFFLSWSPDAVVISTTNSTVFDDVAVLKRLRLLKPDLMVVVKGAIFFDAPPTVLDAIDTTDVDYLIGGEIEFSIGPLFDAHFGQGRDLFLVPGILFKNEDGAWTKNSFATWSSNVDEIPFPDRTVINNSLYVRPDTGKPQATIVTSRGCPAACVYCLTPVISGKNVRFRSAANILEELRDCFHNHKISDFFFRSDTFTIDHSWVLEVCDAIKNSELNGKISWVANSRVRPLHEDTLKVMKDAGCWLVAFGFESGHQESLKLMRKGATAADNIRAAKLAKEAGLKLYGFYLIGLPWEDWEHLYSTRRHILEIDADFLELHVALPYHGTELYNMASEADILEQKVLGSDYFHASTKGTKFLSSLDLLKFRRSLILRYHLRPGYILKKLIDGVVNPRVLCNYVRFGTRLILSNLTMRNG